LEEKQYREHPILSIISVTPTHTHTHTHTLRHSPTPTSTPTPTPTPTHTHPPTHIQTFTYTHTYTHSHTYTFTYTLGIKYTITVFHRTPTNFTRNVHNSIRTVQVLRYELGQKYNTHHDYGREDKAKPCGPRVLTFFLYLSDVEEGERILL
jgi:2OG-Fe(II) oxygenase superfamily